ncbi:phosphomethylpyrimidine kinase [candidate division WOR-3 bacterium]|uniref:Phosphomethylpyrimidine kinase n=1 Tax=candidate division WOR-3 bacterium TaxID=2052148 RepID=A0A937XEX0_UNCW3|nr:phosphomethylpyrimidine kinase [candidate division WOR-3 bacterium]
MNAERGLAEAVAMLESCREFSALVPEVRVNVVYAPEGVNDPSKVLGIDGRITVVAGMPRASGPIRAGVSDHMARLVIETSRHDPSIRAGLNFRWNQAISQHVQGYCTTRGLAFGSIDRAVEPRELIGRDKGSIPWKVKHLVATCGRVPPVFYESRGWGKEPLFFLVGPDPAGVAVRAIEIAKGLAV